MQAHLFAELEGRPVTLVASNAYGDPFSRVARLGSVDIRPRMPGGSPWEIVLRLRARPDDIYTREFPIYPVILLRGEHRLDFKTMGFPPRTDSIRSFCTSYAAVWSIAAAHCAGLGAVLVDTTEAALRSHRERYPDRYVGRP